MGKMRRRSPSVSDGEIVSGNEEKAYMTKDTKKKNGAVNSSTRLLGGASSRFAQQNSTFSNRGRSRSPSKSPYRAGRVVSRSPYRAGRERSRSPYRAARVGSRSPYKTGKGRSGEKRSYDGDHYNSNAASHPRRFKVHYEDGMTQQQNKYSSNDRVGRGQRSEHAVRQHRNDPRTRFDGHQDVHGRYRSRSRSPFRHGKAGDGRPNSSGSTKSSADSSQSGKRVRATDGNYEQRSGSGRGTNIGIGRGDSNSNITLSLQSSTEVDDKQAKDSAKDEDEPTVQVSEAELIEQRRKRREAIKAKHKAQQPLLVQALQSNLTSVPNTPTQESSGDLLQTHSPPSSIGSPRPSQQDSPPASPATFAISNDEDLLKNLQVTGADVDDGPSAADYDPTMDMQEDRQELKRQDRQSIDEVLPHPTAVTAGDEVDMFADEDDDMFAAEDTVNKVAPTIRQARALDKSLIDNWDYPDGHYRVIHGELLDNRYAVKQQIGKGTFATVIRAEDTRSGELVAVKIACNNDTMYKAGTKEMDFLHTLNESDPEDKRHIIRLQRNFDHKGHMCLVFENLSEDLREVLKKYGRNIGIRLDAIRSYAQQMFHALAHMKRNEILHADLKPDNILVNDKHNLLKVCDFGTAATIRDAEITPYLVSRFYRAPEVILGMPFDYAIDMWSIGCTLYELHTGRILFAGSDNNQMLRVIQECRGKFPIRMLKKSSLVEKHFDVNATFISLERDKLSGNVVQKPLHFTKVLPGKDIRSRLLANAKALAPAESKDLFTFIDLMDRCLQLDPARRITPADALRHPFFAHPNPMERAEKRHTPVMAPPSVK